LVIYSNNIRKDQPDKKIERKYFAQNFTWSGNTVCNTTIQTFYTTYKHQNSYSHVWICLWFWRKYHEGPWRLRRYQESKGTVMYATAVEMWGHNLPAKDVDIMSAKTIWVWLLLLIFARIRMKLMNLIICVVFPTLPLLQNILSFLHSWIQKWILNITGIHIPYWVNDNHVIVTWVCYFSDVKLLFFCQ
jgi:hypothetical protein